MDCTLYHINIPYHVMCMCIYTSEKSFVHTRVRLLGYWTFQGVFSAVCFWEYMEHCCHKLAVCTHGLFNIPEALFEGPAHI